MSRTHLNVIPVFASENITRGHSDTAVGHPRGEFPKPQILAHTEIPRDCVLDPGTVTVGLRGNSLRQTNPLQEADKPSY